MKPRDTVKLAKLIEGDTFWYFGRGWIVRKVLQGDAGSLCECLDDGGEPVLSGDREVEVVSLAPRIVTPKKRKARRKP